MNKSRQKIILVYQIGSLGDTLISVPSYKAIRNHFGESHRICVVYNIPTDVRAMPQQILAGSGLVDDYIGFHQSGGRSSIRDSFDLWRKLAPLRADAAVYLAPAERSPAAVKRDKLFFKLCGVRQTIGFYGYEGSFFGVRDDAGNRRVVPGESELRSDRLKRDGIIADRGQFDGLICVPPEIHADVRAKISTMRQWPHRSLIAIGPGANQSAKYWPIDRFAEIGRRLIATGDFEPVIIGGPRERDAAQFLTSEWGAGVDATGMFSVVESAALIGSCSVLIGLDTGTTHLAAAVNTPIVAIYADRDPVGQWAPMTDNCVVLRREVECGGCGLVVCNRNGHPCMTEITVDEVWRAIQRLCPVAKSA